MLQTLNIAIDFDESASPYKNLSLLSCRDVLMKHLDDKIYSGDLSSLTGPHDVQNALRQAYSKVLRLWQHVLAIRTLANTHAAICRLPSEVLLRIFRLSTVRDEHDRTRHWLAFSQVCAHWRRLALADPSLWTQLDLDKPSLALLMVRRSQQMAIHVKGPTDLFRRLSLKTTRVRSLTLDSPRLEVVARDDAVKYVTGEFPLLDSLRLSNKRCEVHILDASGLVAPKLQTLLLSDWILADAALSLLNNLTTLTLSYSNPGPTRRSGNTGTPQAAYTLSSLLRMLAASPRLESLSLTGLIDPMKLETHPENAARKLGVVRLPHLHHFHACEALAVINRLVPCISLQASTHISVLCELPSVNNLHALLVLLGVISDSLCEAGWPAAYNAGFLWGDTIHISLATLVDDTSQPACSEPLAQRFLTLKINDHDDIDADERVPLLMSIARTLLRHAVSLQVVVEDCLFMQDFNTALAHHWACVSAFPALHTLIFDGGRNTSFHGLLFALDPSLARDAFEDDVNIERPSDPFPALRELTLLNLQMVQLVHGRTVLVHLLDYLDRRREQNRSISLVFENCTTVDDEVELLQRTDVRVATTDSSCFD